MCKSSTLVLLKLKEEGSFMKKRVFNIALLLLIILAVATSLAACGLNEEEQKVVGKFEVTSLSIDKYPALTASTYDYFTIEFKDNRKCTVNSKAGVSVTSADAKWKLNGDGEIEVITTSGLAKATEKYKLDGDVLSGTNEGVMPDGTRIVMTVTFKRVAE